MASWSTFHKLHGLKDGYKFILAAERKCIFHTVILDENEREMVFNWIGPNLLWSFEVRLKEVFRIYDLEEMVIRMAYRTWTVAIDDLRFDAQTLSNFVVQTFKFFPLQKTVGINSLLF
ncbi:hypothetical protein RHGRI_030940 [Rhododendron griersonianum]|uniref:DUF4283 domain-containing protein n=1 Tax=Rhododendron griersonianum TaxID=479676 RepID=A0AAV6I9E5_9ERIC|nr:hypothetical protein RHGRI_030940 [Rhododendron griersonianum]